MFFAVTTPRRRRCSLLLLCAAALIAMRDAPAFTFTDGTTTQCTARGGAVAEIMEQACTGFVVEALEDAVEAVRRVPQLSRKRCREIFEKRFTATRMASDYVQLFERLISRNQEKMPEAA